MANINKNNQRTITAVILDLNVIMQYHLDRAMDDLGAASMAIAEGAELYLGELSVPEYATAVSRFIAGRILK